MPQWSRGSPPSPRDSFPAVHLPAPTTCAGWGRRGPAPRPGGPAFARSRSGAREERPAGPGVPLVTYWTDSNCFPLLPKKSHDQPSLFNMCLIFQ